MNIQERVAALRKLMEQEGIDAWIAPSSDPHQSEYLADCWKTRVWISGFTGSAGTVVITADKAGLWTDSRYYIQAEKELQGSGIDLFKVGQPEVPSYTKWLADELADSCVVGFDGKLLSVAQVKNLKKALKKNQAEFVYGKDLIDEIWEDRPDMPKESVFLLDKKFTGESRASKLKRIREKMVELKGDYHAVAALDDIVWMLNIRGKDIQFNPVAVSYVIISKEDVKFFIDLSKVPADVKSALESDGVVFCKYEDVFDYLSDLPTDKTVLIDQKKVSQAIKESINPECTIKEINNIAYQMKAIKNETELEGFRIALIRDGVALVKWLCWLEGVIGKEVHTEITVADKLEQLRSQGENFVGLSFNPICGYKGNGASPHYSAKPETTPKIEKDGILLIDSGAQYLDGTTDTTRTIALSPPTDDQKKFFTLVLKGHIQLSMAVFPKGTTGMQVDVYPRMAMWHEFVNYGHGTGHGIGHFLNVHEGPQSISARSAVPLEPGMVCSNEPGHYVEGEYGIRIENVIAVRLLAENEFGTFYGFETLTMCPIDLNLVQVDMLLPDEKKWLNEYHQEVYEKLSPALPDDEKQWLKERTTKI